jgi:hypothetical protein
VRVVLFAAIGGAGLLLVLGYFGLVPWRPSPRCRAIFCDPYHWQVLGLGIAFCCIGLTFIVPRRHAGLGRACALIAALAFGISLIGALFA